jgi:hypothetical protein
MSELRSLALVLIIVLVAAARADAASAPVTTRIGVAHEIIDGTAGGERLAGKVLISTPSTWKRTSRDTAPTAKFSLSMDGGCSAAVHVSVRAVATSQSAKARARRVTQRPVAVLADGARSGGWLRLVQLRSGQEQAFGAGGYGIAIVGLAPARWVDVRAFV